MLLHHPVTYGKKSVKARRITIASSVLQGQSLNSNLLKGSDSPSIFTVVVLRFWENQIAVSADIEHKFMQDKNAPEDSKFLRFLWNNDGRIDNYDCTSHIFGAKDSPCIASNALPKLFVTTKNSFQMLSKM